MPEDLRQIQFAEYGQTVLHPLAVFLTLVMFIWLLATDTRRILIPLLIVGAVITHLQRVVLGSFDFTMIRLLLMGVYLRVILRSDSWRFRWTRMDTFFVLYVVSASIAYVALWRTSAAVTNRLGFAFDAFLAFFAVRLYFRRSEQVHALMRGFAVIMVLVAFTMMIEQLTRYNMFSIFGGVRPITGMREGRLRAQGAFSHAILAGTFGAVFLPLAWGLRSTGRPADRVLSNLGIAGGVLMTYASSSSGPILSLLASVFGIAMWRYRHYARQLVRWSVVGLIALHFYMQAPVWHLISRVDLVGGSTGWHRYALIDATIRNFDQWAVAGVYTTGHWGWGLNDVTNMFVLQAVRGGAITLLFFVLVIFKGFSHVRDAMPSSVPSMSHKLAWSWGVVLFAHCVSFFGVSYFGQMNFFWYLTLGVLCALPQSVNRRLPEPTEQISQS